MPISIVVGKPGSGKSYYAVSKIAEMVVDWCEFEKRNGKKHDRVLYTNLFLNLDGFQSYIDKRVGEGIDVQYYLHHVDDDFFYEKSSDSARVPRRWWEEIPNGAYIVVDEVHQYMPTQGTGAKDYMQMFTEYIATHRHREHDLMMITQHTDTIHKNILCMATDIYHVVNVKNKVFPFLNIPFSDFDVVKRAFGCERQFANILYGNYIGRAVKIQSQFSIVLKPEIFDLYKSHIFSESGEDRPDLKLSRFGAIRWFIRRHWFHLGIKLGLVFCAFKLVLFMFSELPGIVGSSAGKLISGSSKVFSGTEEKGEAVLPSSGPSPAPIPSSGPSPAPIPSSSPLPAVVPIEPPVTFKEEQERDFYNRTGIYIYGEDYIITKREGRICVGEDFIYHGPRVILQSVDFRNSRIVTVPYRMPAGAVDSSSNVVGEVQEDTRNSEEHGDDTGQFVDDV